MQVANITARMPNAFVSTLTADINFILFLLIIIFVIARDEAESLSITAEVHPSAQAEMCAHLLVMEVHMFAFGHFV